MIMNNIIYLDNQSTTQIDPIVYESMKPYLKKSFGNPSSSSHILGWEAEEAIKIAREYISKNINCNENELIFTSGATESINLAIKGLIDNHIKSGDHIITSNIEHKAVIDVLNFISKKNINITFVPVCENGIIDIRKLKNKITKKTKLCSIIHANNEIGTIQPIKEIGKLCKQNNILFHVDAAQTFGKKIIHVNDMHIDLLSISGHKIYAPKGIGALYVRRKNPRIELTPILHGGGHEYGLRAGTLSVHNIVGFGTASKISLSNQKKDNEYINELKKILLNGLKSIFPDLIVNGSLDNRLEGNLNVTFPNVSANTIMKKLSKIACSTGSACSSMSAEPSHVLQALNLKKEQINNTIRFGIGKFNTKNQILNVIDLFNEKIKGYTNESN